MDRKHDVRAMHVAAVRIATLCALIAKASADERLDKRTRTNLAAGLAVLGSRRRLGWRYMIILHVSRSSDSKPGTSPHASRPLTDALSALKFIGLVFSAIAALAGPLHRHNEQ